MSTPGDPPPPPPYSPPPPHHPGPVGYVHVDPASAGLVREERIGWALPVAVLGSLAMVVALFLDWVETQLFVVYDTNAEGPLEDRRELAGLFDAVDAVKDVTGPDPATSDPGTLAGLFFPWLAIVLTVVCVALVLVASVGLRRAALTHTARIVAVLAVVGAGALAVLALVSLGYGSEVAAGTATTRSVGEPADAPALSFIASEAEPYAGFVLWFWGLVVLAVAGALGPRVVHRLPPGAQPSYGGPLGSPVGSPLGSPAGPHGVVRHSTQVVAIVLTALAALCCLAGYGVVTWAQSGDTVTFAEIGEAARDVGFGDRAYAEAYFGWLGWVVLLWVLAATLAVALGKKPAGVSPKVLRPFLVIGTGLAGIAHLAALAELDGDPGPGALLVGLGLLLALVGVLLPLRTTASVAVGAAPFTGS